MKSHPLLLSAPMVRADLAGIKRNTRRVATERNSAYFNCIGRYTGGRSAFHEEGPGPCDYTSGGLFCLNKVVVVNEAGKEIPVFEFAIKEKEAA